MSQALEKKIIEDIKDRGLNPWPRWAFLAKNYLFWALGFLSLLIGGLAFAVTIYMFLNSDWQMYAAISDNSLADTLRALPFFWMIMLGVFAVVAYYNVRHTKRGYVFSLPMVFGAVVAASFILGLFWYNLGMGYTIDSILTARLPLYKNYVSWHSHHAHFWQQPEQGLLVGFVLVQGNDWIILEDMRGEKWQVNLSKVRPLPPIIEQTDWPVRLMGEQIGQGYFQARAVMPWIRHGGQDYFFKRPMPLPERIYFYWRINRQSCV